MDHCSSHNKHLACDTAHRPRSSTKSELPSALRTSSHWLLGEKPRSWSRKTPAQVQMYRLADKEQLRAGLTVRTITRPEQRNNECNSKTDIYWPQSST